MAIPVQLKNLRLPVIAAPMFLVSGEKLVMECCRNGIVGTFPALNQRTSEGFREWLVEIKKSLTDKDAPFGVNLIAHKSNPRLEEDLKICIEQKVPLIITSLGAISDLVERVHAYGGIVFHDVTTLKHAKKAAEAGVDGLILVSGGAGGHAGVINPFSLVGQIKKIFSGTIILAGSISRGDDILAAQAMGADYVYMGTRFIATEESMAPAEYKQMILNAEATDITYTAEVSGVPANFLSESLKRAGITGEGNHKGTLGDMKEEAKAWKNIWSAGHGVSNISDVLPVSQLITRIEKDYLSARPRLLS